MRIDRKGTVLMITGLLLIAAALFLLASNLREETAANDSAQNVMAELTAIIPEASEPEIGCTLSDGMNVEWPVDETGAPLPWPVDATGAPVAAFTAADGRIYRWPVDASGALVWDPAAGWSRAENGALLPWLTDAAGNTVPWPTAAEGGSLTWAEIKAGWSSILEKLLPYVDYAARPDFVVNPAMEMPVAEIDGKDYIGYLGIPALELELPVMKDWNYPDLRVAPCRYSGSVYSHDIVIAGHNYERHFGGLKDLKPGDTVTFTDAAGNVFVYRVVQLETLGPYDVAEMQSGGWDLTLFTCTYGGANRVTLRCELERYITAE